MARDFVRHVQQLRKEADLQIEDRVRISHLADDKEAAAALAAWSEYICNETLADALEAADSLPDGKEVTIGDAKVRVKVAKV